MVIQNINSALIYENNNLPQGNTMPSNEENVIYETKGFDDKYTGNPLKTISIPTKIYVDKVIDNALNNIACGNNVEDNKRIIRLFSNLIRENPENILRKAYGI